jgi:hypothetical protein
MLNKLFKRLAEAEQKEHELSEKESIVMFAVAANILAPHSAPASPGDLGDATPAPEQRNGSDNAEDEDEHLNISGSPFTMSSSNKEVRAVQSALAAMTRMKKSIQRQVRQYISHEYKLHVCEKEETSQMETKVKFQIPPGVGNKPSMKQGRTFRQAIERHMMTYPVTNCALTPILTEILGKNAGEQDKNTDILTKFGGHRRTCGAPSTWRTAQQNILMKSSIVKMKIYTSCSKVTKTRRYDPIWGYEATLE